VARTSERRQGFVLRNGQSSLAAGVQDPSGAPTRPEMGTLVRLRISLADRPGSLARVASIISEHGGNITAVDVHRAGVISAVDDLVVEFPDGKDIMALRHDLTANGAATLLSHQQAHVADGIVTTLRRAAALIAHRADDPDEALSRSVAELCSSPVAWVSTTEEASRWEAGRFALERSGAIALRTTRLPEGMADLLPGEVWLLAVPDPEMLSGGRVVFVARPLATEFTSTEIARIEAVMALHEQIERLLTRSP
jgi:predicted amino acid-binding ACT domain protein